MDTKILLKHPTIEDIKIVFDLSNDDAVRQNAINPQKITWNEHVEWFNQKINSKSTHFFLAFSEQNDFIGQVRFDKQEEKWVTSISLLGKWRKKGYALHILTLAFEQIALPLVFAYIKSSNIASQKVFIRAGYQHNETISIRHEIYHVLIKNIF